VASPIRVSNDHAIAHRILALLPTVPTATWGRDELEAGETPEQAAIPTPGEAADLLVGVRNKNEPPTRGSRAMYIGIGTIVLILAIIVVVMLLRGRSV